MKNLIEEYLEAKEKKEQAFMKALTTVGKVTIGPTNKGNSFMKYDNKEISNTLTPDALRTMRRAIDIYLKEVIGEV